LILENNMFFIF